MSDLDKLRAIRLHADDYDYTSAEPAIDRAVLLGMVERYRRRFLDIATAAGEDTSGLDNPDQLVTPPIEDLALEAVRELMSRYDECLAERRNRHGRDDDPRMPHLRRRSSAAVGREQGRE